MSLTVRVSVFELHSFVPKENPEPKFPTFGLLEGSLTCHSRLGAQLAEGQRVGRARRRDREKGPGEGARAPVEGSLQSRGTGSTCQKGSDVLFERNVISFEAVSL